MGFLDSMFELTPTGYVANAVGKALGPVVVNATNQAADIEAINRFFADTKAENAAAEKARQEWVDWYNGLSWYDKNVDHATGPKAVNFRNAFLRANAESAEEKKMVDDFLKGGPTVNPVTGQAIHKDEKGDRIIPKGPWIPDSYKVAAVATAAGVLTLVTLKKLHII